MKRTEIRHEFVELIPEALEDGVLYVSVRFATAVHKCFCGCGREVVTPLSPTDWKLTFDGKTVSLDPSIGNWNLSCQSHYWIVRDQLRWARRWSKDEIEEARAQEKRQKEEYFRRNSGSGRS